MAILSAEHSDQLYWLGRYSERVYTTIREFAKRFDSMIELKDEDYNEYCKAQDIPNIYTSKEDFVRRYCFDENDTNSIYSNLIKAYDNAVVLRDEIGSETLSYIQLAVYAMSKAKVSEAPLIQLQKVVDNIVAFWGMTDDDIDSECVRSIIPARQHFLEAHTQCAVAAGILIKQCLIKQESALIHGAFFGHQGHLAQHGCAFIHMNHLFQQLLPLSGLAGNSPSVLKGDGKVLNQLAVPGQRFHRDQRSLALSGCR